ncbi:MAG: CotH kinase family protein [Bacteroidales bacterium]
MNYLRRTDENGYFALKGKWIFELKRACLTAVMSVSGLMTSGQVVINEFTAANSTVIADPDFQDYADWIELYNTGSADQNLKGYYITDNLDSPQKWQFETNAIIPAGGHLLLWTDGRDSGLHASFRLSAAGEVIGLYSPGLVLLDSVTFSQQKTDISVGRIADGDPRWGYFMQATPGASNSTISYAGYTSLIPEFSVRGGFYTSSFQVELSSLPGGIIRYTRDGSEPGPASEIYASAIPVESTTILRARIFEAQMIPGPTVTQSYFINENAAGGKLPLVSIATEPENFWDPLLGIYVQSFKPLWEIPVNVELFENDGSDRSAFNELAGIKVNGLYSWQLPQKMLGVYFKKQYGAGNLDYPLLWHRNRSSYKSFALRASGSDWSFTLFRDLLAQHATMPDMDLDIMDFRPAVVYVNGEYLGIHNIREKVDDDYIEKSYNMEPGSFDLVENEEYAEAGDLEAYRHLETFLRGDLSDAATYGEVDKLVDIENFTDYVITEMATGNTSIDHNVMAWKPKHSGKWRWVLMDLDRGFFNPNNNLINFYTGKSELILNELLENQSYRQYFAGRLSSHLFTTFHPDRMNRLIDGHSSDIQAEIPAHIARWEGTTSTYGNAIPSEVYWWRQVGMLKAFAEARPFALLSNLKSYGFDGIANLVLATIPEDAGVIKMGEMTVPGSLVGAPYIKNIPVGLRAENRPGFEFVGWSAPQKQEIVPRGSEWKFLDTGTDPGMGWTGIGYDDLSWNTGNAQLGYGEDDENTVVSYGGNAQNRFITTYFRKIFKVTEAELDADLFVLELLRDDGAIVYLNGREIIRSNMGYGETTHSTKAAETVNGAAESFFFAYPVDKSLLHAGDNILAVEIHQQTVTSSDLSFDLGFSLYQASEQTVVSVNKSYLLTLGDDRVLAALYRETGSCILPGLVEGDLTLSGDCSPYLVQGDVTIGKNAILTIEPGVEIWMPEGASIFVNGVVNAIGTSDLPVTIRLHPECEPGKWGVISFRNTPQKSVLRQVIIEGASTGPNPVLERGAISAFFADLELDHMTIEQIHGDPVTARYSDITLTNSTLHSEVTGDLINVKYGRATIGHCRFTGNDKPDADAIDYDEVEGGIIRNCLIRNFMGLNSEGIDIGERSTQVFIDSIVVFNIADKGVSVGQKSTVSIENSIFINCTMGVGVKDSARLNVDRSLFYNNVDAIFAFEKNPGQAGGNVKVTNSILSNSSHAPVFADSKSTLQVSHSLSDNTLLPLQSSNLNGNPLFADPSFFNFELLAGSPARQSGSLNGVPVNMGTRMVTYGLEPPVMISQFFINGDDMGIPEFITLYNPSPGKVDLSGYQVTKGITATLPEGTVLGGRSSLYLTDDVTGDIWEGLFHQVFQWDAGRLSNDGEALQLEDRYGIVLDYLVYNKDGLWPADGFLGDGVFQLIRPGLDNHFPESWEVNPVSQVVSNPETNSFDVFSLFPNPAREMITIRAPGVQNQKIEIYDLAGHKLGEALLDHRGEAIVDLSDYPSGLLIIRAGNRVEKVVLIKD